MYSRSVYSPRYNSFNSARTFKKSTNGTFKSRPFHRKPYYKKSYHKHSFNSATSGKGRVIKLVT